MGWAGTDTFHLLNLAWSTDGVHFSQFHFQAESSNFEPSLSPNPFTGSLDIDFQAPNTSDLDVISYTGQQFNSAVRLAGPIVEAPAVTAYGQGMVHAWLGTDPGHTINVCFANAGPPFCSNGVRRGLELEAQDVGESAFAGLDDGAGVMCDQPAQQGVGVLDVAQIPGAVGATPRLRALRRGETIMAAVFVAATDNLCGVCLAGLLVNVSAKPQVRRQLPISG